MKKIAFLTAYLFSFASVFSQLKSPAEFLGYQLGERYSPHFKIVEYFRHLAMAAPHSMKLEQYGVTNEGRPLLLAVIASSENLSRLEEIRQENLRAAGILTDRAPAAAAPAIVWLSYNVHGNETSSSEAAMLTAYELLNPSNANTKEWLKNTIVIIDPCINPDGRDRYVNWFNSVVGMKANPQPFTREHIEPWPGGRSNHYYFDLNRDWAWQTQTETKQRIVRYNQWLPHVHVDFHEQGYDQPYYFAPAAEPFHEVITDWQRDFQTQIGRNHAKYFDRNGWLYFTKERFDLFYPSYGDTYPTYKGGIGMTYEQGGHSRAGTAVINEDGDTLTLLDRLTHHYTTGLSTVEISSQNASRLVQEFKKYYDKARQSPGGEFKSYLVKADKGDRITRLIELLDRNQILWSYAASGSTNGLNYFSGKNENVKLEAGDVIVNSNQSNSNLIKVLFERNSRISDSVTYDITAWSMPYVYGLKTYGLNNYVTNGTKTAPSKKATVKLSSGAYAYAVPWNGLSSAKFLAEMVNRKVRLRYAEQAFTVNGKEFGKGTLLVTRASNAAVKDSLAHFVQQAADRTGVEVTELQTGFVDKGFDIGSDRVRIVKAPRVTLLTGSRISSLGVGEIWHFFDMQLGYPVNLVWGDDLSGATLAQTDVLIMPDGNYRFLSDKTMNDQLKSWVSNGGKLIALENAAVQLSRAEWGFKLKSADEKKEEKKDEKAEDYSVLKKYENRERDFIPNFNPGSIYRVELDNSHPLAYGYEDEYFSLKQDDNIYEYFKEEGWNVGVVRKDNYVAGFTGSNARQKIRDGLIFGVKEMGQGSVVILGDNPLFRSFWENGKLLFCNAVFMVGQ